MPNCRWMDDYTDDDGWAAQCLEEAREELAEVRLKLSAMMAANLELAAERDELRATVERVRKLCEEWEYAAAWRCGPDWGEQARVRAKQLRKALDGDQESG